MKFKKGDVFYYQIFNEYWIIGKVTGTRHTHTQKFTEVFFDTIKVGGISDDYSYYPLRRFETGSPMYTHAKKLKDDSYASLLAVML